MENENYTLHETFTLPSKGLIYGGAVSPKVTLRSMTTADEMKRLSPSELPYKSMCEIIDDCMVGEKPGISAYDMCIGDYQFLLHKLRIVTYGPEYKMMVSCPFCGEVTEATVNLDDLIVHEYEDDVVDLMKFDLPVSKKIIELRLQTPRILDSITSRKKEMQKKSKDISARYDYLLTLTSLIKTVDGQSMTPAQLENFVLNLNMRDVNFLLQKADKLNQKVGLDTSVVAKCSNCGNELVSTFRITGEFFGPSID